MATEDCLSLSSPRISFSFNLSQFDKLRSGRRCSTSSRPNSNDDFEFPSILWDSYALTKSLYADQLFTGGRILTAREAKERIEADETRAKRRGAPLTVPVLDPALRRGLPEPAVVRRSIDQTQRDKESGPKDGDHVTKKACRKIKRSDSLDGSNSCKPRLCFLPLVSRSCSTGSGLSRSGTGPGRLASGRSRVSPVTSVATRDVFGLSTLFMNRRTSSSIRHMTGTS
ncbi:hypothetical protein MLD38_022795 [Melastoma candidum]|uniref:Uncharacterized protein n=1 Tax=Melastoma candidum TaxID=119954 RepID=A0ACB9QJL5_9MYRT|nr:hypothetical protein MLD38_022795 [Melastoma candidum]